MDERGQPDGTGHAETPVWRVNGAHAPVGSPDEAGWSSAGAALEPSAEPLALLAAGHHAGGQARHRQPLVPGLDDETPATGVPVAEPPLWREAARHTHRTGYDQPFGQYGSTPVAEEADPGAGGPPDQPDEPIQPVESGWLTESGYRDEPGWPSQPPDPGVSGVVESAGLPQRVPAEPDVPVSGQPAVGISSPADPTSGRDRWTEPELAFIADQLRRDDVPREAPTGTFDVDAVVAAVREVAGVESASVRTNPTGMHTLRLDLADDADPGEVSRAVARLLLERMGLAAAPQDVPQASAAPVAIVPEAILPEAVLPEAVVPEVPEVRLEPPPATEPAPASRTGSRYPTVPAQARGSQDGWVYHGLDDYESLGEDPEPVPEPVSRPLPTTQAGPRVVIDQVQVRTFGLEATVDVLLTAGERQATGQAAGPAVDSYLVRLAAVAAAKAIDSLLRGVAEPDGPSRCFVEHTGVVPFGTTEVAVVVLLLVCGGWVEQLTGSALVDGDPRQAVVRATLGAVNRRLEALLD